MIPERRVRVAAAILAATLCLIWGPAAWAQDPVHKMGRGVVNVLTGWIELPKQVQLGILEHNPVAGAGWGLVKGLGLTVLRMGIGVYEAVTFPIPYPKHFASPYEHLELGDFAWE
jgi:putative exosortase-associated protein (TIGR04073 family)